MKGNIILVTAIPMWSMNNESGGKALFNTIDWYSKSGYNLFIITNQENDYTKIPNINIDNIFYIDTKFYNSGSGKLKTYKYFKYLEKQFYKYICDILDKIGTDNTILYAYEVNTVKPAKKASIKYSIPLVTRFQGTIMSQFKNNLYYRIRKYPHIQALSTKSDLVIMTDDGTQGNKVLDDYKNYSKRMFIRNGVNILDNYDITFNRDDFIKQFNIPKDNTILLTVSRLVGWKKVDRSIMAFSKLKNNENYTLIIVGDGDERYNLENLVNQLNLQNNIKFIGAVKNKDVYKYMKLSDIFLSFYDLSNVGNPLLEALCLNKPIITYDVGDTNKIIDGNNGILLNDVSPESIAQCIENINNPEKLKELSQNAKNYAAKNLYSWSKRMQIEQTEVDKLFKKSGNFENKKIN